MIECASRATLNLENRKLWINKLKELNGVNVNVRKNVFKKDRKTYF